MKEFTICYTELTHSELAETTIRGTERRIENETAYDSHVDRWYRVYDDDDNMQFEMPAHLVVGVQVDHDV